MLSFRCYGNSDPDEMLMFWWIDKGGAPVAQSWTAGGAGSPSHDTARQSSGEFSQM